MIGEVPEPAWIIAGKTTKAIRRSDDASAAASSAYLTASEIFPLETRALAIACFYALGTAIGGSTSPLLFCCEIFDVNHCFGRQHAVHTDAPLAALAHQFS